MGYSVWQRYLFPLDGLHGITQQYLFRQDGLFGVTQLNLFPLDHLYPALEVTHELYDVRKLSSWSFSDPILQSRFEFFRISFMSTRTSILFTFANVREKPVQLLITVSLLPSVGTPAVVTRTTTNANGSVLSVQELHTLHWRALGG